MMASSQEQALLEFLPRLFQNLGVPDDEALASADDNLSEWVLEYLIDDLPLSILIEVLAKGTGCEPGHIQDFLVDRAQQFHSSGKVTTLGEFVAWLAPRSRLPSFQPINIGGSVCAAAGVFLGMRDVATNLKLKKSRFAPSTPILQCLEKCELASFWEQLKHHQSETLPELCWPWERFVQHLVWKGVFGVLLGVVGVLTFQSPLAAMEILAALLCFSMARNLAYAGNPLPPRVVTFGDLARILAEESPEVSRLGA